MYIKFSSFFFGNGMVSISLTNLQTKDRALKVWTQGYMDVHKNMAVPLSRDEIVQKATARGVDVTEESFDKIYKCVFSMLRKKHV